MLSGFVSSVDSHGFSFFLFCFLSCFLLFHLLPLFYSNGFRHTYTLPYLIAGLSEYFYPLWLSRNSPACFVLFSNFPVCLL